MQKYQRVPLQKVTFDERRMMTKLAAVLRNLLPKGSRYVSLIYIAGGSTGMQARLSSNFSDDVLTVKCLREAADALEENGYLDRIDIPKSDLKDVDN